MLYIIFHNAFELIAIYHHFSFYPAKFRVYISFSIGVGTGGAGGGCAPQSKIWGAPPPHYSRLKTLFFFFFFFFACHPGGRRTVHMYPYPLNWRWWRSGKKSVGVPPPPPRSSAFLGLARPSTLATGETKLQAPPLQKSFLRPCLFPLVNSYYTGWPRKNATLTINNFKKTRDRMKKLCAFNIVYKILSPARWHQDR